VEVSSCPVNGRLNNFISDISEHNEVGWLNAMVTGRLHDIVKDILQYIDVEAVYSLVIGYHKYSIKYISEQRRGGGGAGNRGTYILQILF
jgi:hypothetical protein